MEYLITTITLTGGMILILVGIAFVRFYNKITDEYREEIRCLTRRSDFVYQTNYRDIKLIMDYLNIEIETTKECETFKLVPKKKSAGYYYNQQKEKAFKWLRLRLKG